MTDKNKMHKKPVIRWHSKSGLMEIETEGVTVYVIVGLRNDKNQRKSIVKITAHAERVRGAAPWWINGVKGNLAEEFDIVEVNAKK